MTKPFDDEEFMSVIRELQVELVGAASDDKCEPGKLLRLTALAAGYSLMGVVEIIERLREK